jgi:predicted enzyme related to lactoylglutathione lyase
MSPTNAQIAGRAVDAAIAAGKISASSRAVWVEAYTANPASAKAFLDAVVPVPPISPAVIAQARLDAAAAAETAALEATYARVTGQPVARAPRRPAATAAPVQTTAADEAAWADEAIWKLGREFRAGMTRPESLSQTTYFEDPNAPVVVMNADGTGQWVDPAADARIRSMDALAKQERDRMAEQADRDREQLRQYLAGE